MKKHIFISGIFALIFSLSCDTDLQEQSRKEKTAYQTGKPLQFEGLSVRHRYKTPDDYIDDTKSKDKDRSLSGTYGGKVSLADFSMEDIAEATEKVFKNYPFPSKAKNYQTDFAMIKGDFPNMTEKDIIKNESTIEKYYDINLDYEVLQLLKKTKTPITKKETVSSVALKTTQPLMSSFRKAVSSNCQNNLKMTSYTDFITNSKKDCVIKRMKAKGYAKYGRGSLSLYLSTNEANKYFGAGYGYNTDASYNLRDAKRHIYWSALLAINYYTISSKNPRIKFAKDAGDANEECGGNYKDEVEMDYHNNKIGRDLFSQNGTYNWWGTFTPPSASDMKQKTIALVDKHSVWIKADPKHYTDTKDAKNIVCPRKYNIQNANKSKPVYIHEPELIDIDFACSNKTKTISLKGAYAKKWAFSKKIDNKISYNKNSITIKAQRGYSNQKGWVEVATVYGIHGGDVSDTYKKKTDKLYFTIDPTTNLTLQITHIGSGDYDVDVSGGYPPYNYYFDGNLLYTSDSSNAFLRRLGTSGGVLAVTAQDACGRAIRRAETIKPVSSGGGSGFPHI